MAVLGAILLEKDAIDKALDYLRVESFYMDAHQWIFRAMINLHTKQQPVDILTVAQELISMGKLDEVGGPYAITKLTNDVVSGAHLEAHCRIVQQKFIRRELIRISSDIITNAYDEAYDEFDLIEESEKAILEIGTVNVTGGFVGMETALMRAVERIELNRQSETGITGVPSGFDKIDRATRGWQPGSLIVMAARPAVGKSAMAMNLVRNAAINPIKPVPVAVWSLEMDYLELVMRILAAESQVWLLKLQTGRLSPTELSQISNVAIPQLLKAPVFFDDSSSVSIASFRSKARRLKKKHDIGLIVVDYLQLMSADSAKGNREQEISKISRGMKQLAKELKIPIIALSQLSRDIEKRKDGNKKPQLSDLRESGAIEQDADMVIFLWGPSEEEIAMDADLEYRRYMKIAKHRNGVLTTQEFDFRNEIQLFEAIENAVPKSEGNWKPINQAGPVNNFYETEKGDFF